MGIPRAIWEGEFTICGVTLRCYVLDDEAHTRIINADDVAKLFGHGVGPESGMTQTDEETLQQFVRWIKGVGHEPGR